jgi:catechol 2,3-dioxygenase-like lactoylglutathione lyase family enzyme
MPDANADGVVQARHRIPLNVPAPFAASCSCPAVVLLLGRRHRFRGVVVGPAPSAGSVPYWRVHLSAWTRLTLSMQIIKLAWLGTRTERAEPTVAFFRDVLGLRLDLELEGFWMLRLPDGSKVEVFGAASPINRHFTTGPVAGFLVDDVFAATDELRSAGVEVLLQPVIDDSGNAWVHFRAPDGNIYEFTQDPGVRRPH